MGESSVEYLGSSERFVSASCDMFDLPFTFSK
jgi:hypothetical protein